MMNIEKHEAAPQLAAALESGEGISDALQAAMNEIQASIRADYEELADSHDVEALAARGYRQLTSAERKFYEGLAQALRSDVPNQAAFADFIAADTMPETIMEDVFRELAQRHRLLEVIKFQYSKYATKMIQNKAGLKRAVWGKITAAISENIEGSVRVRNLAQNKLSAYAFLPIDVLDMGPEFIDRLIRETLMEALYEGLEYGIIQGSGHECPVGMMRDVHEGVTVDTTTGYPAKTAVAVTSLHEQDFNDLVAALAVNEFGKPRSFDKVYVVMGLADMLTKWNPAIPSQYIGGPRELSFPCEVITSNQVPSGKAIMFVPDTYEFAIAGNRNGVIQTSDEFKFLDDARYFKALYHGDGIAVDNTCCLYLDISGLRPFVPVFADVKNSACRLESYSVTISDTVYPFVIDQVAKTGEVTVPNGSTITGLAGTFAISDGASALIGATAQTSGTTTNNWTSGTAKNFKVTSEDGTASATYALKITVAASA